MVAVNPVAELRFAGRYRAKPALAAPGQGRPPG
jgi:hypothetical protein